MACRHHCAQYYRLGEHPRHTHGSDHIRRLRPILDFHDSRRGSPDFQSDLGDNYENRSVSDRG